MDNEIPLPKQTLEEALSKKIVFFPTSLMSSYTNCQAALDRLLKSGHVSQVILTGKAPFGGISDWLAHECSNRRISQTTTDIPWEQPLTSMPGIPLDSGHTLHAYDVEEEPYTPSHVQQWEAIEHLLIPSFGKVLIVFPSAYVRQFYVRAAESGLDVGIIDLEE